MFGRNRLTLAALLLVVVGGQTVQAGFITLALTAGSGNTTTAQSEFTFDASGSLVIDSFTGVGTATAGTATGWVYFGGAGVPVFIPTDGSAYIASGSAPTALTTGASNLSTSFPTAGGIIPTSATRLSLGVSPDHLTAVVTDSAGHAIGNGDVAVPISGWWVIGLKQGEAPLPPIDPPVPPVPPVPPPTTSTPEPSAIVIAVLGLMTAELWRSRRRVYG